MSDSEKEKPVELNYARPKPHRSFQEAFVEYVRDETAAGRMKHTSRMRALVGAALVFLPITPLLLGASWLTQRAQSSQR